MRHDLDSLLSHGRLSGAQRERVLDSVLDRVAPRRRWIPWAAAAAILCAVGGVSFLEGARSRQHEFAARGTGTSATRVEVVCVGGSLDACPRGSHLVFHASGPKGGYLTAYAVPDGGGERIWYFSGDDESPMVSPSAASTEPMDRVVVVGSEHGVGGFKVHILISEQPLRRADAVGTAPGGVVSTQTIPMRVVP